MNAHDKLGRQLRGALPQPARRQRRLPGVPDVIAVAALAVTVLVIAVVVVAAGQSGTATPEATAPVSTSTIGPKPKDPGGIPADVDDSAVAGAWNTVWANTPICRPDRDGDRASLTNATPGAAMLSAIPILNTTGPSISAAPDLFSGSRLQGLVVGADGVYRRFIRRVQVRSGLSVYLVPVAAVGTPPLPARTADRCYAATVAALTAELPHVPSAERAATRRYGDAEFAVGRYNLETSRVHDGVFLLTEDAGGVISTDPDGSESPSTIRYTGMLGTISGVTPETTTVLDGIVPAGVRFVTLEFPATTYRHRALRAIRATTTVVDEVFVVRVPTLFERGGWPQTAIWRSASGRPIKQINEQAFRP